MRVAIIPARGGSKRIPHKNIKEFNGKPIIAYSIECAKESNLFDKIIVSTDDRSIQNVAEEYGAEVWSRGEKNSDDFATISDVINEVLEESLSKGVEINQFALIYATAPLIDKEDLIKSEVLLSSSDVVLPVVPFSYPIWRSLKLTENNSLKFNWDEYVNSRSQDLPIAYHDAGLFFWSTREFFLRERNLFAGKVTPYNINHMKVQDIDNLDDWELCEFKARYIKERREVALVNRI